jgi:hypothetical protein
MGSDRSYWIYSLLFFLQVRRLIYITFISKAFSFSWIYRCYVGTCSNREKLDMVHIQQEAIPPIRLEQTAVVALCDKRLRARNVAK